MVGALSIAGAIIAMHGHANQASVDRSAMHQLLLAQQDIGSMLVRIWGMDNVSATFGMTSSVTFGDNIRLTAHRNHDSLINDAVEWYGLEMTPRNNIIVDWDNPTSHVFIQPYNTSIRINQDLYESIPYNYTIQQQILMQIRVEGTVDIEHNWNNIFTDPLFFAQIQIFDDEGDEVVFALLNASAPPVYINISNGVQISFGDHGHPGTFRIEGANATIEKLTYIYTTRPEFVTMITADIVNITTSHHSVSGPLYIMDI